MTKKPEKKKSEAKKKVAAKTSGGAKDALATKKVGPMILPAKIATHSNDWHSRDWAGKPPPKKFSR